MYVSFLSTWCWTSLPFDFLSVLVVRGGAVCLPTPPSWFSLKYTFKKAWYIYAMAYDVEVKKDGTLTFWDNMHGPRDYYAK